MSGAANQFEEMRSVKVAVCLFVAVSRFWLSVNHDLQKKNDCWWRIFWWSSSRGRKNDCWCSQQKNQSRSNQDRTRNKQASKPLTQSPKLRLWKQDHYGDLLDWRRQVQVYCHWLVTVGCPQEATISHRTSLWSPWVAVSTQLLHQSSLREKTCIKVWLETSIEWFELSLGLTDQHPGTLWKELARWSSDLSSNPPLLSQPLNRI